MMQDTVTIRRDRDRIGDATAHIVIGSEATFAFHPVLPKKRRMIRTYRVPEKRRHA